jgi:hypothetical protein
VFCRSLLILWPFYFVFPFFIASYLPLLESVLILTVRRIFPPSWLSDGPFHHCDCPLDIVSLWKLSNESFLPGNCQMELFSAICCYFYSSLRSFSFISSLMEMILFCYYLGWLLFPVGIIRREVSVLGLTWFVKYIYICTITVSI